MPSAAAQPLVRAQYWIVPLARAVVALAIGITVAFSADHTAGTGLILFGVFAVATGAVVGVLSVLSIEDRATRTIFVVSGAFSVIAGGAALVLHGAGIGFFLYIVGAWAAVTAVLELLAGIRRSTAPSRRDWTITGAITALLAVVMLLIPSDPVLALGLLGAYDIVIGVYLAIAGFSLRWATHPKEEVARG